MIPSGPQYWHKQVIATTKDKFAYCSTLSIYICNARTHEIESVIAGHEGTITSIEWSLLDSRYLVSATTERQLYIWNVAEETAVLQMKLESHAVMLQWSKNRKDVVLMLLSSGKADAKK